MSILMFTAYKFMESIQKEKGMRNVRKKIIKYMEKKNWNKENN